MSPSFLADVLHLLLLGHVLQRVAAAGGTDNGSSSNSPNHPVIELIGKYKTNTNPNYCEPPDSLRIFRGDSSPSFALDSNERKLRLCPLPKSDKRVTEISPYDKLLEYCLFEVNEERTFCEDEVKPYLTNLGPTLSCDLEESKTVYRMGSELCFPYVEGIDNNRTYTEGINGLLENAHWGIKFVIRTYNSYKVCYDNENNRTEWAQRWVTGYNRKRRYDTETKLSTDELNLKGYNFEKMRIAFEEQDKNSPDAMVPQMLVPKEENSYLLWEIYTSHYINVAPLWKSLVPLMNLINERIALLVRRIKKALLVTTRPYYNESIEDATKKYLDKENEILIPNIWTITVHEEDSNSEIIIILHNTPNKPPRSNELCDEPAFCDFKKWISISTTQSFGNVTDGYLKYAYCCMANNFLGQPIKNVIDINFKKKITRK